MAVYQQTYRGYSGPLSSPRLRWWVICRQALSGIVQGRSFGMLLLVCLLPIEIALVLTLARLNIDLPEDLQEYVTNALSIDLAVIAQ